MKLQIDLQSTDTTRPIIADGLVPAVIDSVEVAPSKKDANKWNLAVKFLTTSPSLSTKGDRINENYPLRRYYQLQQSDNPDAPDYKIDLAKLFDAAFDIKNPKDRPIIDNTDVFNQLVGRPVTLRVASEDTDQYGLQNVVKAVLPAQN